MKNGVSFGLLLVVGAIGYYFGKKIGSFETAMTVVENHLRTKKEETNQRGCLFRTESGAPCQEG